MTGPLLTRPKLLVKDAHYHEAFCALSAARASGMNGPNAIAISEILALLDLVGIASVDLRPKYLRLIQKLDRVYLDHCAEKNTAT